MLRSSFARRKLIYLLSIIHEKKECKLSPTPRGVRKKKFSVDNKVSRVKLRRDRSAHSRSMGRRVTTSTSRRRRRRETCQSPEIRNFQTATLIANHTRRLVSRRIGFFFSPPHVSPPGETKNRKKLSTGFRKISARNVHRSRVARKKFLFSSSIVFVIVKTSVFVNAVDFSFRDGAINGSTGLRRFFFWQFHLFRVPRQARSAMRHPPFSHRSWAGSGSSRLTPRKRKQSKTAAKERLGELYNSIIIEAEKNAAADINRLSFH